MARGNQKTSGSKASNGYYQPIIGDYDGNQLDDILWYS